MDQLLMMNTIILCYTYVLICANKKPSKLKLKAKTFGLVKQHYEALTIQEVL